MWIETLAGKLALKAFPLLLVEILGEKQVFFVLGWLLLADRMEGEDT